MWRETDTEKGRGDWKSRSMGSKGIKKKRKSKTRIKIERRDFSLI